jgi:ABC-type branched-subunit amino acid transport system substrate-binding protein
LAENQTKDPSNVEQLKNAFTRIPNSYSGITGKTSLDQNGDRKYGDYEYWVVRGDKNNAALHIWKPTGRFVYEKSPNGHR